MRFIGLLGWIGCVCAASACGASFSSSGESGPATASASSSATGSAATTTGAGGNAATTNAGSTTATSGAGGMCGFAPPADWNGPLILSVGGPGNGGPLPPCGGEWKDAAAFAGKKPLLEAHLGLCQCRCDQPKGASCDTMAKFHYNTANDCMTGPDMGLDKGVCTPLMAAQPPNHGSVDPVMVTNAGSCGAGYIAPSQNWLPARLCEPVDGCSGTVPTMFSGLCVYQAFNGDTPPACPEGFAQQQRTVFTDVVDARSCANPAGCTCGAPNTTCSVKVKGYPDVNCMQASAQSFTPTDNCKQVEAVAPYLKLEVTTMATACTPMGEAGPLTGTFTASKVQVCCAM